MKTYDIYKHKASCLDALITNIERAQFQLLEKQNFINTIKSCGKVFRIDNTRGVVSVTIEQLSKQPLVPLGFSSYDGRTGETTFRTKS